MKRRLRTRPDQVSPRFWGRLRNRAREELVAMRGALIILREWKWFLAICGILTLAYLALIRANFYYLDDQGRMLDGHMGWMGFSRYTTTVLAGVMQMGAYMADLSPLTTLLAIAIIAAAGLIIVYTIKVTIYKKTIKWWDVLAVAVIGITPYFTECMSYKFDAPFMALSVLMSVIPFVFYQKSRWGFYGLTAIGTMVMCTTYQASSGVFPMMVVAVAAAQWNQGAKWRELGKFLLWSSVIYLITIVIFKEFLMFPQSLYVSNEVFDMRELLPGILGNLNEYYGLVISDSRWMWLVLGSVIIGEFVTIFTVRAQKNKLAAIVIGVGTVMLLGVMAFGLYVVLVAPLTAMRGMYGIGVAMALLAVMVSSMAERWVWKIPAVVLTYNFVIFATVYGNMLAVQDAETKFRAEALAMDLADLEIMQTEEPKQVKIYGGVAPAKAIQEWTQKTGSGALMRLIPVQMYGDGWTWGQMYFFNQLGLKTAIMVGQDEIKVGDDWEKPISNLYHDVYTKDNQIVIYIK